MDKIKIYQGDRRHSRVIVVSRFKHCGENFCVLQDVLDDEDEDYHGNGYYFVGLERFVVEEDKSVLYRVKTKLEKETEVIKKNLKKLKATRRAMITKARKRALKSLCDTVRKNIYFGNESSKREVGEQILIELEKLINLKIK